MPVKIPFTLNGKKVEVIPADELNLLWILRTHFGLTGSKYGCGEGYCGSCTVLINNDAVRSCQVAISDVRGKEIVTIEGLADKDGLHPLQKAFITNDALQCGYCTPGMIMNAVGLLNKNPTPSREEIISQMDDNLCRCGAYDRLIDAIQMAAVEMKGVASDGKR
jgi:aerobic-type carbon monoxide dehydrogenase small subunit (CoxS/CutS family)